MSWTNEGKHLYNNFLEKHKNILILFFVMFFLLSLRLFYLQVIKGDFYKDVANNQRVNTTNERAFRGIIYDSDNQPLVKNQTNYVILFYPFEQQQEPSPELIEHISKLLNKDVMPFIEKSWRYGRVIKIAENLTLEEVFKIQEQRLFLPGIVVVKEPKRIYINPIENAHVIGYVGQISEKELEYLEDEEYKSGDYIGKGGIERYYDKELRGIDGGLELEVNARGHQQKAFNYNSPKTGNSLYLTLDSKLQKVVYDTLLQTTTGKGAAVVMDVKTGAVKALVSCPSYDTNNISKNYNKYIKNKKLPFFNRTIQALYPPGSTFKIVTFIAALEHLNLDPNHTEECLGTFELGDRKYSCMSRAGHKKINLIRAMAVSCNIYFYHLGLELGYKVLEKYSKMFHFGEQTGIDMPSEKKGFFPTPEWKKSKMKMTWLQGDTVILSIGQGALTVTPLQMAAFMTAIANKGIYYKPYLVDKIVDTDTNELIYKHTPQVKDKIVLKEETWKTLNKALIETVENGTGKRTKFENMKVAAKTGTAENPHGDDHAWVVAYAPADNPEIAIAVIVENGGGGGTVSVPVAREIFKYYFNIKDEDENADTKKGNKINAAR